MAILLGLAIDTWSFNRKSVIAKVAVLWVDRKEDYGETNVGPQIDQYVTIHYAFDVGGKTYEGSANQAIHPGQKEVAVYYQPENPMCNRLTPATLVNPILALPVILIMVGICGVLLLIGKWRKKAQLFNKRGRWKG